MLGKIDYVIVMVSNMPRSIEFYHDGLGLPLKFESPQWTEFQTGATTLALHAADATQGASPAEQPGGARPGTCSLGFMVDDLEDAFKALTARGVRFTAPPAQREGAGRLAICVDPDNLPISLSEKRR